jgi:hypothetical protein
LLFIVAVFFLLIALVGLWQLPSILKAIPSRYVARLPEPIQALGVREHVDVLPTVAFSGSVDHLLQDETNPSGVDLAPTTDIRQAPATPTPPPTRGPVGLAAAGTATSTPAASPTSTPLPTATSLPIASQARLTGIQHRFQDWNNCGPATLAMALTYFDIFHTQEQTASVMKPDPEDRNVSPWEMADYVNDETAVAAMDRTNGTLYKLRRLVSNGFPVIVEIGIDPPGEYAWMEWYGHYLLLVAYDDAQETFWVYDSWFGTSEVPGENADDRGREISYGELDDYWRQFNRNYVVLYEPDRSDVVAEIIGADMNDETMWQSSLQRTRDELAAEPENEFLWFDLGTIYNAQGNYERAADAFDKARSIGLPWRMLWYQFGPFEAYYRVGRYQDVLLLANVTLQDRPYFEESFYYRGLALRELGDRAGARESLERAVEFNPHFAPAAAALQELELANG